MSDFVWGVYIQVWCNEGTQNSFYFCLPLSISKFSVGFVLPLALWRASLNNFDGHFQEIKTLFLRTKILNSELKVSLLAHLRPLTVLQEEKRFYFTSCLFCFSPSLPFYFSSFVNCDSFWPLQDWEKQGLNKMKRSLIVVIAAAATSVNVAFILC